MELNAWANEVAQRLREVGAGPDALVAVCLERGVPMVVALQKEAVSQRLSGTIRSAVEAGHVSGSPAPARASRSYVKEIERREWADESERRVAAGPAGRQAGRPG
jgi:non-ribosomal peptide synthetase component F